MADFFLLGVEEAGFQMSKFILMRTMINNISGRKIPKRHNISLNPLLEDVGIRPHVSHGLEAAHHFVTLVHQL